MKPRSRRRFRAAGANGPSLVQTLRRGRRERAACAAVAGLAVCAALVAGCGTPPQAEPAPAELRHRNWWNFYERGAARLAGGEIRGAKDDFEVCLDLRPGAKYGYPRDTWRARTYGLHFLEGYFPNREYGICLYELGETDKAVGFLETSLGQEPSGRAKHYLNLARQRVLSGRRVAPPEIVFAAQAAAHYTRERSRELAGYAAGDGLVRAIAVNERPQFIELAERRVAFSETLPLKEGRNTVKVVAVDLTGQQTARELEWIADWRPPRLTVQRVAADGQGWVLDGACSDDCGLAAVRVNGERLPDIGAPDKPATRAAVRVVLQAGKPATLEAEDLAGNKLSTVLTAKDLAQDEAFLMRTRLAMAAGVQASGERPCAEHLAWTPAAGRLGSASPSMRKLSGGSSAWRASGGRACVEPRCRENRFPALPFRLAAAGDEPAAADTLKPRVRLNCPGTSLEVFAEEFLLEVSAQDPGGLAGITVGGEQLLAEQDRGSVKGCCPQRLPLEPGTNRFDVVVTDLAGNRYEQTLTLIRRIPEYLDAEFRLTVGVPPLVCAENDLPGAQVKRRIESELLRDPPRFHLLERDEGWDFILREQQLSVSDLADPRSALRIGKMLPAELLLMGSVLKQGAGLAVHARIVATDKGQILLSEDVYTERPDTELAYQVEGLVMKIEQRFPLAEGKILAVKGDKAKLDVGSRHGVRAGTSFVVVQPADAADAFDAGTVRHVGARFVELSVTRAQDQTSVATVRPDAGKAVLSEGDRIYAR